MSITVTLDTEDRRVCREVGEMFLRLAGAGMTAAETVASAGCDCTGECAGEPVAPVTAFEEAMAAQVPGPVTLTVDDLPPYEHPRHAALRASAAIDPAVASATIDPAAAFAPQFVPAPPAGHDPTPQVPTTAGPELDAEGLPWDKRIHSSSKAKIANGQWRLAKNIDKSLVEQVKAELRGVMAAPTAPVATPLAPVPTVIAPAAPEPPAVATPPVPAPVAPPAPTATGPTTVQELLPIVIEKQQAGLLTVMDAQDVCKKFGLPALPSLGARPDLVPAVYAELEKIWTSRQQLEA